MLRYPQIYGYVWYRFVVIHRNLWITVDKTLWTGAQAFSRLKPEKVSGPAPDWPRRPPRRAARRGGLVVGLKPIPNIPEKKLSGQVIEIANVGEQKPNSDAKVFQLLILINESDTTLRPGMTTSNNIISGELQDVLFIPVEALHSQGDSISYVFKKDGLSTIKQEVFLGKSNADEVVILKGLQEKDMVYLSDPDGMEGKKIERLDGTAAELTAQKQ